MALHWLGLVLVLLLAGWLAWGAQEGTKWVPEFPERAQAQGQARAQGSLGSVRRLQVR